MSKLSVNNPYNGKLIKKVNIQSSEDVETAIATAHGLFQNQESWLTAF